MKTATKLRLKDGIIIGKMNNDSHNIDNSLLPIWEVGYSNATDSEKYYDLIPLPQYSPNEKIRSLNNLSFYLEHEKEKIFQIFTPCN